MDKDTFKKNLQTNIVQNPNTLKTQELLKELGLFPLPKNIDISISDDNNYLNLKLLNTENSEDHHLLFQIPLKEKDLSALIKRDDYTELLERYDTYKNEYKDKIKQYAIDEATKLREKFPDLVFSIKIRIKSLESYREKLNEHILAGKTPYINDIMAERIIISGYNGSQDEKILTKMCYEVAKALYDFRINTDFRMKPDDENNSAKTDKEYITKDYIAHPKENGYQSIHILMQDRYIKDFTYETQIRTFEMESVSKNNEKVSHKKYKPRILNDRRNKIPTYALVVPPNKNTSGNAYFEEVPYNHSFYHFYNEILTTEDHFKKRDNITYQKYNKELFEIQELLGMSFQNIREKLKNIDISKYVHEDDHSNKKEKTIE